MDKEKERKSPTIEEPYPDMSEEERLEMKEFLEGYAELIVRVHERLEAEKKVKKHQGDKS